jgi:flagellar motor switch protein FliM
VNQVLSQDEVDALLSAVDRGELGAAAQAKPAVQDRQVYRYNFRRPNRISKDQLRILQSMHESMARLYTSSLTTMVRGLCEVELRTVEQISYGEFIMSISSPTCIAIFNMEPLKGVGALEISANVLFVLIDRLLGGSGLIPVKPREFTEVEQVLIERLYMRAMLDLRQGWQNAGNFGFRIAQLETSAHFLQLTSPNEVVIVVTFRVAVGETEGRMAIAFPHLLLEPIMSKLNTRRWFGNLQRATTADEQRGLQDTLVKIRLRVCGVLAQTTLTVQELLKLQAGDVLALGTPPDQPAAVVEVEGVPRFTARPGISRGLKALQVLTVLPRGETRRDTGSEAR